jgi:deoxyribonuclease V
VDIHPLHSWDISPAEAVALQRGLAARVVTDVPLPACALIAGADVSYDRGSDELYAAVVVLRAGDLSVVERRGAVRRTTFPYVPGLLSFREAPVLLQAFARVESRPDVVMCDGQGIAHPRRLGLASHVGLGLDVPCIGCAKSLLTGHHADLGEEAGARAPLLAGRRRRQPAAAPEEVIGCVVRTKKGTQPVFVSPGHRIDLESSVRWVLACVRRHRLPEPTRLAHLAVNDLRRGQAAL